eukprot:scaffold10965_cov57-Phaeocystis_antarctica.AAC.1
MLEIWSEPFVWSVVLPWCAAIIASCCCLVACFRARLCVLRRRHGESRPNLEEDARCSACSMACSWAPRHARAKTKLRWVPLPPTEDEAKRNILAATAAPGQNDEAERQLFSDQSYVL